MDLLKTGHLTLWQHNIRIIAKFSTLDSRIFVHSTSPNLILSTYNDLDPLLNAFNQHFIRIIRKGLEINPAIIISVD